MSTAPIITISGGKGTVSFPPGWNELSPIERADALIDVLRELEGAYHAAVKQFLMDAVAMQARYETKQ